MGDSTKTQSFFNKNKITLIAVLAFAVALCCIFAFAGNNSEEAFSSEEAESSEYVSENGELKGVGIYIEDCLVAAVDSESTANEALDEVLALRASYLDIENGAEVAFNNDIELVNGEYPSEAFTDANGVSKLLGKESTYSISDKVVAYNGDVLPVKLSVRSVTTFSETVLLEYETKTVYTDSMRDGATKVVTKGYNGEGTETYQIVAIDGVESVRETLSVDVTVAPTNEIVRVGTQSDGKSVASLGTFVKPFDGVVTSYTGPRWGRTHNGIDIAGNDCNGKPAVAACDGVVVRADWYNGYGNCVIIDHGNGVQTLYAHLSKITVNVGDVLSAGDEVGKIGSTGNSTGPHLHFEVHVDGEIVNPLIFVNYDD